MAPIPTDELRQFSWTEQYKSTGTQLDCCVQLLSQDPTSDAMIPEVYFTNDDDSELRVFFADCDALKDLVDKASLSLNHLHTVGSPIATHLESLDVIEPVDVQDAGDKLSKQKHNSLFAQPVDWRHYMHIGLHTLKVLKWLLLSKHSDTLYELLTLQTWRPHQGNEMYLLRTDTIIGSLTMITDDLPSLPFAASELAAHILSLLVSRYPTRVFSSTADWEFSPRGYLLAISIAAGSQSFYAAACSLVWKFLEILPFLYVEVTWKKGRRLLLENDSISIVAMIVERFLRIELVGLGRDPDTSRNRPLLALDVLNRGQGPRALLEKYPVAFAVAAGMEVLGWCANFGYDMASLGRIPFSYPSVIESLAPNLRHFRTLAAQVPSLAPAERIARQIVLKESPIRPPSSASLLRGPLLRENRRCGLIGCHRARSCGGGDLKRCAGKCCSQIQYCCPRHQQNDWESHMGYCLSNG